MKLAAAIAVMALGLVAAALTAPLYAPWIRSLGYRAAIRETARAQQVDPRLVYAVIWQESRFDAERVGKAGEIGLMQITTNAAREWAGIPPGDRWPALDLAQPQTNIAIGTWYLARALRRWAGRDDPLPYALAEYNAGPSNARRWAAASGNTATGFIAAITYPTTRRYIAEIQRRCRAERP
jgi:soluble lytic murein transglycosylase